METYLQQFEETYNLLNEIITPQAPASGAIAATSDPARKDFGPAGGNGYPPSMNKKGLLDPYQSHPLATMGDPDRVPSMPYPLENINSYLSDSYVYLNAAITQMTAAAKSNPALSPVFAKEIERLSKEGKKALQSIEYIGQRITSVANLNY
jgi:hypothetical protein